MNFIDTYNSTRMLISLVVKMILLHDWLIEYQLMIEMLLSLSFFPIFFSIFYVYCIGTVVLLFDGPNECCSFAHLACCKTQIVLFVDLTVCDGICCSLSLSRCVLTTVYRYTAYTEIGYLAHENPDERNISASGKMARYFIDTNIDSVQW